MDGETQRAPGWYPDERYPEDERYWDGASWRGTKPRGDHAVQPQCFAALRVQQNQVCDLERGDQAFGVRGDAANANRYPQSPAGLDFQLWAKVFDSRHNPAVQRAP